MSSITRNIAISRAALLSILIAVVAIGVGPVPSADALGSGKFPWRGDNGSTYYYYGSGGTDGSLAYATTTATGTSCLLYVKRVKTKIQLPNGSFASHSSLLGQCSSGVDISRGGYTVFQIKSTHTLQKWSGTEYNYVL